MRRRHNGLTGVRKDNYPLPNDLQEFNYYYQDSGHVIMAVPECLLEKAEKKGDLDMYECPLPCKYVLEKGYRIYRAHVICDAVYDPYFGVDVPDSYYEW